MKVGDIFNGTLPQGYSSTSQEYERRRTEDRERRGEHWEPRMTDRDHRTKDTDRETDERIPSGKRRKRKDSETADEDNWP